MKSTYKIGYGRSKSTEYIQLNRALNANGAVDGEEPGRIAVDGNWDNYELVAAGYGNFIGEAKKFDLILAFDDNRRGDGCLFLGHWNSGIGKEK
jgi:hypothetical protein